MPADWRKQTAELLSHGEQEGFQLTPRSIAALPKVDTSDRDVSPGAASTPVTAEGTAADFEAPWYHSPLPPLRLEVVLLQYDRIVAETIDRASRRIEKVNEDYNNSKMRQVLFQIRSEMRTLFR